MLKLNDLSIDEIEKMIEEGELDLVNSRYHFTVQFAVNKDVSKKYLEECWFDFWKCILDTKLSSKRNIKIVSIDPGRDMVDVEYAD